MNSMELGQRLMPDITIQDLSMLTANDRLELLDAINSGIQTIHAHGPAHWKTAPKSVTLRSKEQVEITLVKYSKTFTGYDITDDDLYCTIVIDGDPIKNKITAAGELMDDFLGESGTYNAFIYHDAVVIYEPIERLATDPKIIGSCERGLVRDDERMRSERQDRYTLNGLPTIYALEANARNQNPTAGIVMRVNSLPEMDIRLRFDVELSPVRITFADLSNPKEIPVRDDLIEAYLKPIIRKELATSSLWKDKESKVDIRARGDEAEMKMKNLSLNTMGHRINRVGTPRGY